MKELCIAPEIWVKMDDSWSAKTFRQVGEILSGPGALLILCFRESQHTFSTHILSAGCVVGAQRRGLAGGVDGCVEKRSEIVCWNLFSTSQSSFSCLLLCPLTVFLARLYKTLPPLL